jgi:hypothetical protein
MVTLHFIVVFDLLQPCNETTKLSTSFRCNESIGFLAGVVILSQAVTPSLVITQTLYCAETGLIYIAKLIEAIPTRKLVCLIIRNKFITLRLSEVIVQLYNIVTSYKYPDKSYNLNIKSNQNFQATAKSVISLRSKVLNPRTICLGDTPRSTSSLAIPTSVPSCCIQILLLIISI